MESIKELVGIVSKNKVKQIHVIGNEEEADTKITKFYRGVLNGEYISDEKAASALYNSGPKNKAYIKLKNRLRNRLLDTLFFIDVNQPIYPDIMKAYYSCNKKWIVISNLLTRGERKTAIPLAEEMLAIIRKFEFIQNYTKK